MSERYAVEDQHAFTHILVAVDGSEASIHAGHRAIQMAAGCRIPVVFVYVLNPSVAHDIAQSIGKLDEVVCRDLAIKAQHYLDYFTHLARDHGLAAEQMLRQGVPHTEISEVARERGIDLIVIGQTVLPGSRRTMTGSVAQRIIECAPCSVLVVRHSPPRRNCN